MLRCITICYALVFVLRYGTLGSSTALYPNRFRVCWSVEKVEHKTHECLCSAFFKSCYNTALLVTGNSDILVLFWGVLVFSGHCSCYTLVLVYVQVGTIGFSTALYCFSVC